MINRINAHRLRTRLLIVQRKVQDHRDELPSAALMHWDQLVMRCDVAVLTQSAECSKLINDLRTLHTSINTWLEF